MNLKVHRVVPVMTRKESMEIRGEMVPHLEANIVDEGIYVDAETGEPFLAYMPMPKDLTARIRKCVLNVRIQAGGVTRQGTGSENASRTFGMSPRKPFQTRETCRPTSLSWEQPEEHQVLVDAADELSKIIAALVPEQHNKDVAETAGVLDEWRISEDSLWTSGVINKTSTLPYHIDGNNFDVWSAMPVVRRGIRGGYLNIPEYNAVVECRDGWALFFPGYRLVHGVTPITHTAPDAYRYSIVYYCLRGMKDCFTYAVEQTEGMKRRTEREKGLASALRGETDFKVGGKK